MQRRIDQNALGVRSDSIASNYSSTKQLSSGFKSLMPKFLCVILISCTLLMLYLTLEGTGFLGRGYHYVNIIRESQQVSKGHNRQLGMLVSQRLHKG